MSHEAAAIRMRAVFDSLDAAIEIKLRNGDTVLAENDKFIASYRDALDRHWLRDGDGLLVKFQSAGDAMLALREFHGTPDQIADPSEESE